MLKVHPNMPKVHPNMLKVHPNMLKLHQCNCLSRKCKLGWKEHTTLPFFPKLFIDPTINTNLK